jgi:RIO kinase 1
MPKIVREKHKTSKYVFDDFTERNLFKLSSKGYFDELESPFSMGKEANIFIARKGDKRIIVKIYRLTTCDFFKMYEYLKGDPRFNVEKNRRKIIFSWAKREYYNLLKARSGGVRVPSVYGYFFNILVMELIGDDLPCPLLKDKFPKNPKLFFDELINQIKKLYKAGLVHADLSHFNIMNFDDRPVLIDFSQSTVLDHPMSDYFLLRDVKNVCSFFSKLKVVCDEQKIINIIKKG